MNTMREVGAVVAQAACRTDQGRVRANNEDYVWADAQAGVYVVADGVGGREAGEWASYLAATTVGQAMVAGIKLRASPTPSAIGTLMFEAITTASQRVRDVAGKAMQQRSMAATLVVVFVYSSIAYIAHVGDTRVYLARRSRLTCLTKDDTLVAQMIDNGTLLPAEARFHPQRHMVTKVVGQTELIEPSFAKVALVAGDTLLLCSDGLWSQVDDTSILRVLNAHRGNAANAADALIAAANAAGGEDNVSVIIRNFT